MKKIFFESLFLFFLWGGFCLSQETTTTNFIVTQSLKSNDFSYFRPNYSDIDNDKVCFFVDRRSGPSFYFSGFSEIDSLPYNNMVIYSKNLKNDLLWYSTIYSENVNDTLSSSSTLITFGEKISRIRFNNQNGNIYYFNGEQINSPENRIITVFFDANGKRLPYEFNFKSNNLPFDSPLSIKYSNINENLVFSVVISAIGNFSYNDSVISTEDCVKLLQFKIDTIQKKILLLNQRTIATFVNPSGSTSLNGTFDRFLYINNKNVTSLVTGFLNLSQVYFYTDNENTKGFEQSIGHRALVYDENLRNMNVCYFNHAFNLGSQFFEPILAENNFLYLPIRLNKSEDPNFQHGYYQRIYSDKGELIREDFLNPTRQMEGRFLDYNVDDKGNYYIFYEYHLDTLDLFHRRYIVKYDQYLRKSTFVSPEIKRNFFFNKFSQAKENRIDLFYYITSDTLFDFKNGYQFYPEKIKGDGIASIQLFPDLTNIQDKEPNAQEAFSINYIELKDILHILPNSNDEYSVSLYTINGNEIYTMNRTNGAVYLDTRDYSTGTYLVKVKDKTQTQSYKFVIQR
ncbi:MAG: T9SS type A sorting domain-containing protein [Candidatus Kapabacteria bacterium]|nr:T9SS type A sorting domain-containing protein [Candidatus Kapabacteria bacterium]